MRTATWKTETDIRWAVPERANGKGVLLLHSTWGLTPGMIGIGHSLAEQGFHVAMPDEYGGILPASLQEASRLSALPREVPVYRLLFHAARELLEKTGADTLGILGFSSGAHWAVRLAQHPEIPVTATVLFYGARAGDFSASRSDFQCHFARDTDAYVSTSGKRRMLQALASAGRPVQVFEYPRCGHWFAEKGIADCYSPTSAQLALERAARFLGSMSPVVGERIFPPGRMPKAALSHDPE